MTREEAPAMPLPVRTALADIQAICGYFLTKPAGATPAEVINEKALSARKLAALKFWGLVDDTGAKLRLSERGVLLLHDNGAHRAEALRAVLASIPPYAAVIARAVSRNEMVVLSTEVAAHWHQSFRADVNFGTLNHQIVCFLRVAEGAGLGHLVVGRKGQQTRFELDEDEARSFVDGAIMTTSQAGAEFGDGASGDGVRGWNHRNTKLKGTSKRANRVFIAHRSNKKILEQVKELVEFGKFEPVVARDRDISPGPFLHNLTEEMRGCVTAVIHVGTDGLLLDGDGPPRISGDVLIEIGAAIALYGRNFVLLVEDGVELPPNLQGLSECRYSGDELNMPATMKLLRSFNDFTQSRPTSALALTVGADHVVPHLLQYERTARPVSG
jgi:Predicted nucleotide-binding protein containing TIR-like domain